MSINNREGYIAVWLGKFNAPNEFQSYIRIEHKFDKTFDSQFEKDFGLKYYDRVIFWKPFKSTIHQSKC